MWAMRIIKVQSTNVRTLANRIPNVLHCLRLLFAFVGKPYKSELLTLSDTYAWAIARNLGVLSGFRENSRQRAAYFIGSGGSLSGAVYGAYLHSAFNRGVGVGLTPLEFSSRQHLSESAVFIYSAGGGNVDVLSAFRHAVRQESEVVAVLCLNTESKLTSLTRQYEYVDAWIEPSPVGGDGFLATNSLLAFFILSYRIFQPKNPLPPTYDDLKDLCFFSEKAAKEIVKREHLIVLYGPSTHAVALDFESKMSEAGLASVQLADFRNFAHGRHNWIAKKSSTSAVLSFVTPEDQETAQRTHDILREICPVAVIEIACTGALASLAALSAVFAITGYAGDEKSIDPGRPGVPSFGRKIYNLRMPMLSSRAGSGPSLSDVVRRKLDPDEGRTLQHDSTRLVEEAAKTAHTRLRETLIRSLVLDFDDTICGRHQRFGKLLPTIQSELERIASHGIPIGIATGRGQSVRSQLRDSIAERYWSSFMIGYYNGSVIAPLTDDLNLVSNGPLQKPLSLAAEALGKDDVIRDLCNITLRSQQITLEPKVDVEIVRLWREACRSLSSLSSHFKIVHSSRSIDVLYTGTSKTQLVNLLAARVDKQSHVLCIGDQGRFPGNDFELLSHPLSLSSDRCSYSLDSCWNFAPLGYRQVQATKYYLNKLVQRAGGLKLNLPDLR